ncbi:hypothetical protein EP331_05525 [bacterium]|nr:MAG: hypothetical protein EP331_05525 [bacterium]
MKGLFAILLFFLISLSDVVLAQYQFDLNYLTADNGLSQNVVNAIYQDSRGYLWIGTNDGLNKYDGFVNKVYQRNLADTNSIASNGISSITETPDGIIWIGHHYKGISTYNYRTHKIKRMDAALDDSSLVQFNQVSDFVVSKSGALYVLTDLGVLYFDDSIKKFRVILRMDNQIKRKKMYMEADSSLLIWENRAQITRYSLKNKRIQKLHFPKPKQVPFVVEVQQISDSAYIIGLDSTLYFYRSDAQEVYRKINMEIPILSMNLQENTLWIGSYDMVLYTIQLDDFSKKPERITQNFIDVNRLSTIRTIGATRDGVVWIGTNGLGISKLYERNKQFGFLEVNTNMTSGLLNQSIRSILPLSEKEILIGGYSGLEKYNIEEAKTEMLMDRSSKRLDFVPYSLIHHPKKQQKIWIGTEGSGLATYDFNKNQFDVYKISDSYFGNIVRDMEWLTDSVLMLATAKGIVGFDVDKKQIVEISGTQEIREIASKFVFKNSDGLFYVGTETGELFRFTVEQFTATVTKIDLEELKGLVLYTMQEDEEGMHWLGSSGGLIKLDKELQISKYYSISSGLPNNTIYSIQFDLQKNIWMSTNNGVSKFNPQSESFNNYTILDGLQSNEFNTNAYANWHHRWLYLGGVNGLNFFEPLKISNDVNQFKVNVSYIEFGNKNKTYQLGEWVELSRDNADFSVHYSTPIFKNPNATNTYFRILPLDTVWQKNELINKLTIQNLSVGKYEIQLIRSDYSSKNQAQIASVFVQIHPRFYEIWYVQLGIILLFLMMISYVYVSRLHQLRVIAETSKHFAQQVISVQELERKRVSEALHDSIGSKMMLIKMALRQIRNSQQNIETESKFNEVNALITGTVEEIREISHNLHPHLLERLGFAKSMESLLSSLKDVVQVKLEWKIDEVDPFLNSEQSLNLYRFVQEALTNMLKHAEADSCSIIIKNKEAETILVEIIDDGKGFDLNLNASGKASFGVNSMQQRASFLRANFSLNSKPGNGTHIQLHIPIHSKLV